MVYTSRTISHTTLLTKYGPSARSYIGITTMDGLQHEIRSVRSDPRRCQLVIIVDTAIPEIGFDVGSNINALKVARCGRSDPYCRSLLIDGSSTFNKLRLDEWEEGLQRRARRTQGRCLFLGPDVDIQIGSGRASSYLGSVETLSSDQRDRAAAHLEQMQNVDLTGSWWKRWKGPVAGLMGILGGGGAFAGLGGFRVTARGMFVSFSHGKTAFSAGYGSLKASGLVIAVGKAALIGGAVGLAVYFMPWEVFFSYTRGLFQRLWGAMKSFWNWLVAKWDGLLDSFKQWRENANSQGAEKQHHSYGLYGGLH